VPDLAVSTNGGACTLLQNWTDARHFALVLTPNGTTIEMESICTGLPNARATALHPSALDEEGRRLLGMEKKLLIVRPDGYVGFRGPLDKPELWQAYARQDAL
jgi:hypothetical protein